MTRQTPKKAQLQRFSGPELSELLELVASEHGPQAAIAAVNRVRSGGVAGFFCKEEFEVIVDLRGTKRRSDAAVKKAASKPAKKKQTKQTAAKSATAVKQAKTSGVPAGAQNGGMVGAPLSPAPTIDLASPAPVAQTSLIQPPSLPQTPGDDIAIDLSDSVDGTHAGFMAMLQRRLEEAPPEDDQAAEGLIGRAPAAPVAPAGAPRPNHEALSPTATAPAVVTPDTEPTSAEELEPEILTPGGRVPMEPSGFWLRLQEIEDELAEFMPVPSAVIAIVGPLSLTTPIVRSLQAEPEMQSADVLVLTGRTEIVSEPRWQLVRSGNQLIEEVQGRINRRTILVLDVPVEFPNWVPPLLSRLRMAGTSLFRFAIPGEPSIEKLEEYRRASDVPYVLDLVSRTGPTSLVDFIARQHPIASVSGAEMTAELVLALRKQVGLGR